MKTLLYPCCGTEDLYYFLYRFMDDVDRFIFADLNFRRYFYTDAVNKVSEIGKVIKTERKGRFYLSREKGYLEVEPEYFYITFVYKGKEKEILFRRGCAQFALLELEENSLDYFVHRGDSNEGGSRIYFLSNLNPDYKPISRLYDKLLYRLKPDGYIISDGSNIRFKNLIRFYKSIYYKSREEVLDLFPVEMELPDSRLISVDILNRRYNHTIVWKVKKYDQKGGGGNRTRV